MPEFRRYAFRLLAMSGKDTSIFTGHNSFMNFNEGKRALGIEIEKEIKAADIEKYLLMIKEAHVGEKNKEYEVKKAYQKESQKEEEVS